MKRTMIVVLLALAACGGTPEPEPEPNPALVPECESSVPTPRQEVRHDCGTTSCGGQLCCTLYDDNGWICTYQSPTYPEPTLCEGYDSSQIAALCAPNGC